MEALRAVRDAETNLSGLKAFRKLLHHEGAPFLAAFLRRSPSFAELRKVWDHQHVVSRQNPHTRTEKAIASVVILCETYDMPAHLPPPPPPPPRIGSGIRLDVLNGGVNKATGETADSGAPAAAGSAGGAGLQCGCINSASCRHPGILSRRLAFMLCILLALLEMCVERRKLNFSMTLSCPKHCAVKVAGPTCAF